MQARHNDGVLEAQVQDLFTPVRGYLNTATCGIPPRSAVAAVRRCLADWETGALDPFAFDEDVDRARRAFAEIGRIDVSSVGIVGQVSVATALVASSLPEGATVLCPEEDFTSVLYPFLVDPRIAVRLVPLNEVLDAIDDDIDLVAVSAVQSADGRMIDLDRLARVAAETGTRTYVDVTQAAGWLPMDLSRFDVTAAGAYKWLCSPRGTGFVTVRPGADWVLPRHAGWYSSDRPWDSVYGPRLRLADDARRFNVSPAWFGFAGAAPAVETIATIGVDAINAHSVGLANRFRSHFGLEPSHSAIVSIDSPDGDALAAAGVVTAARAGCVRLSFYLYNTDEDVDRAAAILRGSSP